MLHQPKMIRSAQVLAVLAAISLVGGTLGLGAQVAHASSLTGISDTMSNETISASATSTIKFTTPTGMTAGQTFVIGFPTGFNFTSKTYTGVTITYGASTGLENSTTLNTTSGTGQIGVSFSGTAATTTTITLCFERCGQQYTGGQYRHCYVSAFEHGKPLNSRQLFHYARRRREFCVGFRHGNRPYSYQQSGFSDRRSAAIAHLQSWLEHGRARYVECHGLYHRFEHDAARDEWHFRREYYR